MRRTNNVQWSWVIVLLWGLVVSMGCSPEYDLEGKSACRSDSDCPVNQLCQDASLEEDGACVPIGSSTTSGETSVGEDVGTSDAETDAEVDVQDVGVDPVDDVPEGDVDPDTAPNTPPTARIDGPIVGVVGEVIVLDGSGSLDEDGALVSWVWSFGDGSTGSGERVEHVYNEAGEYTATLTVADNNSAEGQAQVSVLVRPEDTQDPVAVIVLDADVVLENEDVTLRGDRSADPGGEIVAWRWSVREESSGALRTFEEVNPSVRFQDLGEVSIELEVEDNEGRTNATSAALRVGRAPSAEATVDISTLLIGQAGRFDASSSSDDDGSIVQYNWSFGDGESSMEESPIHAFALAGPYTVRLTVVDDDGFSSATSVSVEVIAGQENTPPIAHAGPDQNAAVNEEVTLSATSSSDPDGEIVSYRWELPGGAVFTSETVRVAFPSAGTYVVTLRVTDNEGATATDTARVVVSASPNEAPTARAGADRTANQGESLIFSSAGSSDPDGSIVEYLWDFGDGTQSRDANPRHSYTQAGGFLVTLTVTDDDGATGVDEVAVTILGPNIPPVAVAGPDQTVRVGQVTTLDGSQSSDADGEILVYLWNFNDGSNPESGAVVERVWDQPGEYEIRLTVVDDRSGQAEDTVRVVVEAPNQSPNATFEFRPTAPEVQTEVGFDGSGSTDPDGDAIISYAWDFGDGTSTLSPEPRVGHIYAEPGTYTVRLTVTDARGASAASVRDVVVECSVDCFSGTYRRVYFSPDNDEPARGSCDVNNPGQGAYTFSIPIRDCPMAVVLGDIIMDCGGILYTGEFVSDDTFEVSAQFPADGPGGTTEAFCGEGVVDEFITGTFQADGSWVGTSDLELTIDRQACGSCSYQPTDVFGLPQ